MNSIRTHGKWPYLRTNTGNRLCQHPRRTKYYNATDISSSLDQIQIALSTFSKIDPCEFENGISCLYADPSFFVIAWKRPSGGLRGPCPQFLDNVSHNHTASKCNNQPPMLSRSADPKLSDNKVFVRVYFSVTSPIQELSSRSGWVVCRLCDCECFMPHHQGEKGFDTSSMISNALNRAVVD